MSKKMTPCEMLGYKVGDKFEVVEKSYKFDAGDVVCLQKDDGTASPYFTNEIVKDEYPLGVACFLSSVRNVAKLKPAKQALADAIHKNGGWCQNADWSSVDKSGLVAFFNGCKPTRDGDEWLDRGDCEYVAGLLGCGVIRMQNWHQTILSRDEYLTAYPEQKVEAEMKSESEMTIKVGDWHKNGDLPPVGEFVDVVGDDLMYGQGERNREVIAHVENAAVIRMGYGLGCFASHALAPAKSERDWAIYEMLNVIHKERHQHESLTDACSMLYDAGYRKEVK